MTIKEYIAVVVVAVVGSFLGFSAAAHFFTPQLGGDFAGGITPNNLFSANVSLSSVTPVLSNLYVNGGISAGGVGANNQITTIYTATAAYPTVAGTIGSAATSTFTAQATTTQVAFNAAGFSIGDDCNVTYTGTTSTLIYSGTVTAVSGSAVTSTITMLNATGSIIPVTVTSTVTGASSTIKATCFHTGV